MEYKFTLDVRGTRDITIKADSLDEANRIMNNKIHDMIETEDYTIEDICNIYRKYLINPEKKGQQEILKKLHFDKPTNIVITDPCYLINHDKKNDKGKEQYFDDLEVLYPIIYEDTLYGDWGCTTFKVDNLKNPNTAEPIGQFCADGGMVCVADYDEAIKNKPEFAQYGEWTRTIIPNFVGDAFIIKDYEQTCFNDYGNDPYDDYCIRVQGKGTYGDNNEPILFSSSQTSL